LSSLERLTSAANASLLPAEMGQAAAEQIAHARKEASRSEAWASWLPRVADCHGAAIDEVNRALARAMQGVQIASTSLCTARQQLWPKSTEVVASNGTLTTPTGHAADSGPEDCTCLWLAACQYFIACENVEVSYQVAFALLSRQEKQTALLARWLDDVLSRGGLVDGHESPVGMAAIPPQEPASPVFQRSAEPLRESVELSALVVHEVDVEVCRECPRATSSDSTWFQCIWS
jgi:hypothetical protein